MIFETQDKPRAKTNAATIALAAVAMLVVGACTNTASAIPEPPESVPIGMSTDGTTPLADAGPRHCFADDDNHLLVLDFGEAELFTGAIAMKQSVAAVSGEILFTDDNTIAKLWANVGIVGAFNDDGDPSVEEQEWTAIGSRLSLHGGVELTEVDCDGELAEEVGRLDATVGGNFPPMRTA